MGALTWQPFFPPTLIVLTGVGGAVLCVLSYIRTGATRRNRMALLCALRLVVIAAVCFVLFGPSRMPDAAPEERARRPLYVWLDTSGSMLTDDMEGQSRYAFALAHWLDEARLAQFQELFTARFVTFDEAPVETTASQIHALGTDRPFGASTRLVGAMAQRLMALPDDADGMVLLLSDGNDSADEAPTPVIEAARRKGLPIYAVPLGGPRLERDLHVMGILQQPYLVAGEEGALQVRIMQANAGNRGTTLRVTTGGETQTFPVAFEGRSSASVTLPLRYAEPGSYEYQLTVDGLPGEVELRNNHQALYVDVSGKRFRALLIEGEPYWETKFIAQALRRDDRIELVQVSQIAPDRRETLVTRVDAEDGELPASVEELARYDVVILGRAVERLTGPLWLEHLVPYVTRHGGRVILSRGRFYSPAALPDDAAARRLQVLEPVRFTGTTVSDVRFQPSALGASHPAMQLTASPAASEAVYAELPTLVGAYASEPLASASVLAELQPETGDPPLPGLVTMNVGGGRVLCVLGVGLWRWRMAGRDTPHLEGAYELFWSSLVRWMLSSGDILPGADVGLHVHPRQLQVGEPATVQVTTRYLSRDTPPPRVEIIGPGGVGEGVTLQDRGAGALRRTATFTPREEGVYRVRVHAPGMEPAFLEKRFHVYALNTERLRSAARPGVLSLIARETGGALLDPYRPETFLRAVEKREAAVRKPPRPEYIWDSAWAMAGLLLLAGTEWINRKRWGWM